MIKNIKRIFTESFNAPKQKDDKWLEKRRRKICASEIASLIGENTNYIKPQKAIENKIKPVLFSNKYMRHGERYEPIARQLHSIKTDIICIELNFLIDPVHDYIGASPDGMCFVVNKNTKTEWALNELKNYMNKNKNISMIMNTNSNSSVNTSNSLDNTSNSSINTSNSLVIHKKSNISNKKIYINLFENNLNFLIDNIDEKDILNTFLIEIKCPSTTEVKENYIPEQYKYQMLCQMSVCKTISCDFVNNRFLEVDRETFDRKSIKYISGILFIGPTIILSPELENYYSTTSKWDKSNIINSEKVVLYRDPNFVKHMEEECMAKLRISTCNKKYGKYIYWILKKQCTIVYDFDHDLYYKTLKKIKKIITNNYDLNDLIFGK